MLPRQDRYLSYAARFFTWLKIAYANNTTEYKNNFITLTEEGG